jgi:hypothetical protein
MILLCLFWSTRFSYLFRIHLLLWICNKHFTIQKIDETLFKLFGSFKVAYTPLQLLYQHICWLIKFLDFIVKLLKFKIFKLKLLATKPHFLILNYSQKNCR